MSNALKSLSMFAALGVALAGSPLSSDARGVTARSGSPVSPGDVNCWGLNGPTVANNCAGSRAWHIPLTLDGSFTGWYTAIVTATAASAAGDVSCRLMSADKNGTFIMMTNFVPMPSFNGPSDVGLSVWVPGGGTAMLDCFVNTGSRLHTVNY
jgi:hypothetical protein